MRDEAFVSAITSWNEAKPPRSQSVRHWGKWSDAKAQADQVSAPSNRGKSLQPNRGQELRRQAQWNSNPQRTPSEDPLRSFDHNMQKLGRSSNPHDDGNNETTIGGDYAPKNSRNVRSHAPTRHFRSSSMSSGGDFTAPLQPPQGVQPGATSNPSAAPPSLVPPGLVPGVPASTPSPPAGPPPPAPMPPPIQEAQVALLSPPIQWNIARPGQPPGDPSWYIWSTYHGEWYCCLCGMISGGGHLEGRKHKQRLGAPHYYMSQLRYHRDIAIEAEEKYRMQLAFDHPASITPNATAPPPARPAPPPPPPQPQPTLAKAPPLKAPPLCRPTPPPSPAPPCHPTTPPSNLPHGCPQPPAPPCQPATSPSNPPHDTPQHPDHLSLDTGSRAGSAQLVLTKGVPVEWGAEAIISTTNTQGLQGGPLDANLRAKGGQDHAAARRALGHREGSYPVIRIETGTAKVVQGSTDMGAAIVILASIPSHRARSAPPPEKSAEELFREAYRNAFREVEELRCRKLACPIMGADTTGDIKQLLWLARLAIEEFTAFNFQAVEELRLFTPGVNEGEEFRALSQAWYKYMNSLRSPRNCLVEEPAVGWNWTAAQAIFNAAQPPSSPSQHNQPSPPPQQQPTLTLTETEFSQAIFHIRVGLDEGVNQFNIALPGSFSSSSSSAHNSPEAHLPATTTPQAPPQEVSTQKEAATEDHAMDPLEQFQMQEAMRLSEQEALLAGTNHQEEATEPLQQDSERCSTSPSGLSEERWLGGAQAKRLGRPEGCITYAALRDHISHNQPGMAESIAIDLFRNLPLHPPTHPVTRCVYGERGSINCAPRQSQGEV